MPDAHANFAISSVATPPSPATTGTTLIVSAGDGAKFPTAPFNATVWPTGVTPTTANAEIVRVTAKATDTLTIVRTQEGSSARTIIATDQIMASITVKTLTDIENLTMPTLAAAMPYVVDSPDFHGAVHNGVTNDTAAIIAAINNAVTTAQTNGSNYAEVWFSPAVYAVTAAQTKGGATLGNAQIPLPVIVSTGQKFVLRLCTPAAAGAAPAFTHWQQTVFQKAGAVLQSNMSQSYDATYGTPSVIGGPTSVQLGTTDGGFSNMLFEMDGLSVVMTTNPSGMAVDLQCLAQAKIGSLAINASVVPTAGTPVNTNPSWGLRMPMAQNNALSIIDSLSVEGFNVGLVPGEHMHCKYLVTVYNVYGVQVVYASAHGFVIDYWCCEQGTTALDCNGTEGAGTMPINIAMLDTESQTGTDIVDSTSGGSLVGLVNFCNNNGHPPSSSGTNPNLIIVDLKNSASRMRQLAQSMPYVVDSPDFHGAVHNGTTDDTAAFNSAISNAYSVAVANGSYYAEIWLSPAVYAISGALITGGTTLGRAQIPLPNPSTTGQKFMLIIKSMGMGGNPKAHWLQTTVQKASATLLTNANASYSGALGSASCIGGPTAEQTSGSTFANLWFRMDGVQFLATANNNACVMLDLRGVAECKLGTLAFNGQFLAANAIPTVNSLTGVAFPRGLNNDQSEAESISCEAMGVGVVPSEHTHIQNLYTISSYSGVAPFDLWTDMAQIDYWSSEVCKYHLDAVAISGGGTQWSRLNIANWDMESAGEVTAHLNDPNNSMKGTFNYHVNNTGGGGSIVLTKTGGTQVKLIRMDQVPGHVAAPTVPATTVALVNPFDRDAAVTVNGGTVTVIAVDGTATGLTSGTVIVPSCKSITLTYSVAPTWVWVVM